MKYLTEIVLGAMAVAFILTTTYLIVSRPERRRANELHEKVRVLEQKQQVCPRCNGTGIIPAQEGARDG